MNAAAVRDLMRGARSAALATRLADGAPFVSFVTVACDVDASPLLLLSDLSDHTANLKADGRAALLFEAASRRANPQTGPRVSVLGRVERTSDEHHRRRFLARHPDAALYADFADFGFYRLVVERAHFVGGFARARWFAAADLMLAAPRCAAVAAGEADVLASLNDRHAAAIDAAVARRLRLASAGWRAIAVDPEGIDVACRRRFARLRLATPASDGEAVVAGLIGLGADDDDAS